jgi:hypothetical protein
MENDLKQYIEQMVKEIALSLGSLYLRAASTKTPHRLVFPEKRQGAIRVSEQESKVLSCRYLDSSQYFYSVETPTTETYIQKGSTALSARIDLTLYDTRDGKLRRVLNIEFKAHNCTDESIRKDVEKLIREKTDGIWFHTLEKADNATFKRLFSKFVLAFQKLKAHYETSDRDYLFVLCTLDPNYLLSRWVSFNGGSDHNTREIGSAFAGREGRSLAGWNILNLSTGKEDPGSFLRTGPAMGPHGSHKVSGGLRAASLILAPEINQRSFLHLSTRGSSYYLRDYSETGPESPPRKFRWKSCQNLEEFRSSMGIVTEVETTPEDLKMNIDKRPDYWFRRIQAVNRKYLPSLPRKGIAD